MSVTSCWKNAEFFTDVVRADLNLTPADQFSIAYFRIEDANLKTAGYMSLMHRVTLRVAIGDGEVEERCLRYVVKEKSQQVFGGEFVDAMQVFPKEIAMYADILPAFEEILLKGGEESVTFGPRVLKAVDSSYTVIVMEDLKAREFRMKDRSKGLDLEDCKVVIQKIAQFHAASVAYREQKGEYPKKFNDGTFFKDMPWEPYYDVISESFLQVWDELKFPSYILDAIRPFQGKIFSSICQQFQLDPTKFNVLNHGDLWINNMQFCDKDLLLVDYQTSFYGSPSYDLIYFIINTAATDIRTDKFDYLVELYHNHLTEALSKLQAKTRAPTLQELHEDIQKHGLLTLALAIEAFPIMLVPEIELDMELMSSTEEAGVAYRRNYISHPRVVRALEKLLPFIYERGFLSVND